MGVSDLMRRTGLAKSTTHRLLAALEAHRLVQQFPPLGKFGLGSRLAELGAKARPHSGLIEAARAPLAELSAATGETAHLAVLIDGEVLSIFAVEGPRTLRTPATVGRKTPIHTSSLGKAILARMSKESVDELFRARRGVRLERFTRRTITSLAQLHNELFRVRVNGYAVDDEEYEEGLRCIGAAVLDGESRPVAAVSIAGPAGRLRDPRSGGLADSVRRAAAKTSAALSRRRPTRSEPARHPSAPHSSTSAGNGAAGKSLPRSKGDKR